MRHGKTSRRMMSGAASLGSLIIALTIPKCPMCIVAALSAWGFGATLVAALIANRLWIATATPLVAMALFARSGQLRRKQRACTSARA